MMTAEEKAAFEKATTEKLEAQLATKTAESALVTVNTKMFALETEVKTLRAENVVLDGQTKALAVERDAAVKKADEVEGKLIENEVEALVGVKIAPTEKEDYVTLRKENPKLFEKMIAQRSPLGGKAPLVNAKGQGEPVIAGTNETASLPSPLEVKGIGTSIAEAAMKLAEAGGAA